MRSDDTLHLRCKPIRCQHCGYYCDPQDSQCSHCHASLKQPQVITDDITEATRYALQQGRSVELINTLAPEALMILQILPSNICIPQSLQHPVILGRKTPSEDQTIIDLTEFHARELGVSRHHLKIQRVGDQILAVDLDSGNHSYLNNTEMVPYQEYVLTHNDHLTLGRLYMNVLFSLPQTDDR